MRAFALASLETVEEGNCPPTPRLLPAPAVIRGLLEVEEVGALIPPTDPEIPTVCKVQEMQR